MSKDSLKEDNTVIMSDEYLSESGIQGGKAIGEHLALGSFIVGIPFLTIGAIALIAILFDFGIPSNTAVVIGVLLVTVIGFLLVLGGYSIYRDKRVRK